MIRQLDWQELLRNRGDGQTELYGYEADCGFESWYEVEMYFGSDSYGWDVGFNCESIGDFDDPDAAKACAQADFERRVRACLTDPSPISKGEA